MASILSQPLHQGGKLVSLEGDFDTVSTQLRLLPPSPKILVLPSLLENLPQDVDTQPFNARAYIRQVHTAFKAQTEMARSFLRSSTTAQPRLAFISGGSVGARSMCIEKICENITNGEIGEAETIFNQIVKGGVAGLTEHVEVKKEVKTNGTGRVDNEGMRTVEERDEDPIIKAMKAADSLDRETAELQDEDEDPAEDEDEDEDPFEGNTIESDQSVETSLSISYPKLGFESQNVQEVKNGFFTSENGDDIVRTVLMVPSRTGYSREKRSTFGSRYSISRETEDGYDYNCDDYYDPDVNSQAGDPVFSEPPTAGVVYGEAFLADVSLSPTKSARKVKSVDRFFPSNSRYQDWDMSLTSINHAEPAYGLARPESSGGRMQGDKNPSGFQTLPRTSFMKASQTTIRKSSTASEWRLPPASKQRRCVFVDRGTDAGPLFEAPIIRPEKTLPFEAVFAVVEDLVIHFPCDHNTPSRILERVISSYKNGSYPIYPPSPEFETSSNTAPSVDADEPPIRPSSRLTAETDDDYFHQSHEFDPYATNNYTGSTKQSQPQHKLAPPTPTPTPPPSANGLVKKFCEFSPINPNSVLGVQNSLRSLLNLYFPAGENGYTQHYFPVSPEMDRLWKPVFRYDDKSSTGNESRTVDQIIALGCEEGVRKDFFTRISGQVERLGIKRDGLSRSGRVDLRYFIANAMQAHSTGPLSIHNTVNPFSSPEVLATFIIPQIEAYLAANTSRLLILHYPFNHLATIMALRKLLGHAVFTIAGVVDSLSSDPPPRTNYNPSQRRNSITSHISALNTGSHQHEKPESGVSFSKANYLLPSTATNVEITTFLSEISMSLMEKSTFYIPEPEPAREPKPIFSEKLAPPPTPAASINQRDVSHRPVSNSGSQGRESKIARLTGTAATTCSRTPTGGRENHPKYVGSVTSTTRTAASARGKQREEARIETDWENFYIGDEDSEDDDYDRMVLGSSMSKIVPKVKVLDENEEKISKKKALKWLGLA